MDCGIVVLLFGFWYLFPLVLAFVSRRKKQEMTPPAAEEGRRRLLCDVMLTSLLILGLGLGLSLSLGGSLLVAMPL